MKFFEGRRQAGLCFSRHRFRSFRGSELQGSNRRRFGAAKSCNSETLKPDLSTGSSSASAISRRAGSSPRSKPNRAAACTVLSPAIPRRQPRTARASGPLLTKPSPTTAVHAVYVGTPVFLHAPQTIQSLRAGKHVLCEKPMAMNEAEARTMLQVADRSGKTFGVAYYRRSYPKVQRAKQLLEAGAIGRPVLAELTCHAWFDGKGSRGWLVDPAKAGGGPLFDVASHRIDVLNFLFGQPLRVTAQLSNVVHHYAVEDNATVMIEYAGGVRGVVDVRWHSKVVARRMPHPRNRWRDGIISAEWPRAGLSRRARESSAARQPALPHAGEFRRCHRG